MPLVALCLTVLLGAAALAVDAGYLQYKQRVQQTATDAAAIAGAWQLVDGKDPSAAGLAAASSNGFTNNGTTITVNTTSPPGDGPNSGNDAAVEAKITSTYPALFSAVLGRTTNAVSTRAVAIIRGSAGGPCIYVLDGNFAINNGSVTGPCGVLVSGDVQANSKTRWSIPSIGAGGHILSPPTNAAVSTGIPPFEDPCSMIPGCTALVQMYPLGSDVSKEGVYSSCSNAPPSSTPLGTGCYKSLNGDYTLSTGGLYVISGDLTGSLVCTSPCTGGVTVVVGGRVNLNGSTTNLQAPPALVGPGPADAPGPNTGAAGVVFYQAGTSTSPENFSAQQLLGMVYAPNAHVNQNASSSLTVDMLVVGEYISNGNTITIPNGSGGGGPVQTPVLAE